MTGLQITSASPNAGPETAENLTMKKSLPQQANATSSFAENILHGLAQPQKFISAKYLYDDTGSALFTSICRQPEYYPARTETPLLERSAAEIAQLTGGNKPLVEFGSGASQKTRILLDAMPQITHYVPIDISSAALDGARNQLRVDFPGLCIEPLHADFTQMSAARGLTGLAGLGFFPGSTIGNFTPPEATALLADWRRLLGRGSQLLLGVDLKKDPTTLIRAYDDAKGVTAAFNLNLLVRINRELRGTFQIEKFEHRSIWNAHLSRIEMHLASIGPQIVEVGNTTIVFGHGETIHTESSYKYNPETFTAMAKVAGWEIERGWLSHDPTFALILFRAA